MRVTILPLIAVTCAIACADEIRLTNGKHYKDIEVEYETDTEVSFLYAASPDAKIKESLIVPRTEVLSLTKDPEDIVEFKFIKKKCSDVATMSDEDKEVAMRRLNKFIKAYPTSEAVAEAKELIKAIESQDESQKDAADKAAEAADKAMNPEQKMRKGYDLDATALYEKMLALAKSERLDATIQAMKIFDRLKKDFEGSEAYVKAYTLATKIVPPFEKKLAQVMEGMKEKNDAAKKEMDARRKTLDIPARQAMTTAWADKEAKIKEDHREHKQKVRERGERWYVPLANNLPSHEDLRIVVSQTKETLKGAIADNIKAGAVSKLFVVAWDALDKDDYAIARESFQKIRAARIDEKYFTDLDGKVRDLQASISAKKEKERQDAKIKREEEAAARAEAKDKAAKERAAKVAKERGRGPAAKPAGTTPTAPTGDKPVTPVPAAPAPAPAPAK